MKIFGMLAFASITIGLLVTAWTAPKDGKTEHKHGTHADTPLAAAKSGDTDVVRMQNPSYPLAKCVISGETLGKNVRPLDYVVNGRLIRLCCEDCKKAVDKDPAGAIEQIDAAVIEAQKTFYPLKTDAVTGAPFGDHPVDHVHGTRLIRFASKDSIAAFEKDPKAALAKVDAALIEAQKASYPARKCIVSGDALGGDIGDSIEYLYGTRLIRFCCKDCIGRFEADPEKYLAKLDLAAEKEPKSGQ